MLKRIGGGAMDEAFEDVLEFHEMVGAVTRPTPGWPSDATIALREKLIREEIAETLHALEHRDLVGVADGIADAIYVLIGTAGALGIPLPEVWAEVHASNMRKRGGGTRGDGKACKSEGWKAPDVAGVLKRAGWEG